MLDRFRDKIREKVVIRGVVGVRLGSSFLYLFFTILPLYLAGNSFTCHLSRDSFMPAVIYFFITNLSIHAIFIIIIRMFIIYLTPFLEKRDI